MKNLKSAVATVAWRNNGSKAPITVMFVQTKERASTNLHSRLISRGLGVTTDTKQTLLYNYTEDVFNEDFNQFGIKAEDITNEYRDEHGNISAHELNYSTEQIFGEPVYISRYETTDDMKALNEDGSVKAGWSVKQVNGIELTHEGALIYSTHIFTEDGVDIKLQHDQDLSSSKSNSVSQIKESKPASKKAEKAVEAVEEVQESTSSDEDPFFG